MERRSKGGERRSWGPLKGDGGWVERRIREEDTGEDISVQQRKTAKNIGGEQKAT